MTQLCIIVGNWFSKLARINTKDKHVFPVAVSYTHLDVYKRQ